LELSVDENVVTPSITRSKTWEILAFAPYGDYVIKAGTDLAAETDMTLPRVDRQGVRTEKKREMSPRIDRRVYDLAEHKLLDTLSTSTVSRELCL
jgi:hypothetical protein